MGMRPLHFSRVGSKQKAWGGRSAQGSVVGVVNRGPDQGCSDLEEQNLIQYVVGESQERCWHSSYRITCHALPPQVLS